MVNFEYTQDDYVIGVTVFTGSKLRYGNVAAAPAVPCHRKLGIYLVDVSESLTMTLCNLQFSSRKIK